MVKNNNDIKEIHKVIGNKVHNLRRERKITLGKFKDLAQHCIFNFINIQNNRVANDKIQKNRST